MDHHLPIASLITGRRNELGLSRSAFVTRCGYQNIAKALRRLDALMAGDVVITKDLIRRLPSALELPAAVVSDAVEATEKQLQALKEEQERATFRPHSIILTEKTVPRPLFIAALTGVARWKRIDLDVGSGPETFLSQTRTVVKNRMVMFGGSLPMHGVIRGFVINFAYDLSIRYTLDGQVVEAQPHICRVTEPAWTLGHGKPLTTVLQV